MDVTRRVAVVAAVIDSAGQQARADFVATYTWSSWLFGWLVRMLAQALYFTTLGYVLGGGASARYLILGNSLMTCVVETTMVVASTARERETGTLPLLVAAPAPLLLTFATRGLFRPISGMATSLVALLTLGPLFGFSWSVGQLPPLVLVVVATAVGSYCVAMVLAAAVLHYSSLRNVLSNIAYLGMMVACGVQVPVSHWPRAMQVLADVLPLTYTLRALRRVAQGIEGWAVVGPIGTSLVIAGGWLIVAQITLSLVVASARKRARLDLGW